ncbi:MAG: signal recognition particle protein [Rickettsiaceae bacterium]|nr:signal recognition particle protein [Rickettsiaceae bacterium]
MFSSLTKNLTKIFDRLRNSGTISENHLNETMRDVRIALIEADVALPVVKDFIEEVKQKALGQGVIKSISPGQMIIKILHDELVNLLKTQDEDMGLNLSSSPPVSILMAGLQGSGKTTSTGKLALHLKKQNKRTLLVSLDIYRPAAREQIEIIGKKIEVDSLPIVQNETIEDILRRAQKYVKNGNYEVVIYDTAGRLNIDEEAIEELKIIKSYVKPKETLLVVDSLMGQDAVTIAKDFNNAVNISGIVLTRVDGDGRGGAALSVKYVTGAPIKFIGTGEKMDALEQFIPERIASRILDMGDIVSLVEKAAEVADSDEMEKMARRMQEGKFNFNDYKKQLANIQKIGGVTSIMSMIPGISKLKEKLSSKELDDKPIKRQIAIIDSMTKKERRAPGLLNASRKKRIADGSGTSLNDVNKLINQYQQIVTVLKKVRSMDQKTLMRNLQGLISNVS